MTPSVPDWGLGRAFGVGETGAGWGLWPLSARQGANGPIGGGSGTRTSACTDISPTSLHHRKRLVHQCRVEIPLTVWKTGSTVFLVNRQLGRSPEVVASVRRARTARVLDAPAPRGASTSSVPHCVAPLTFSPSRLAVSRSMISTAWDCETGTISPARAA